MQSAVIGARAFGWQTLRTLVKDQARTHKHAGSRVVTAEAPIKFSRAGWFGTACVAFVAKKRAAQAVFSFGDAMKTLLLFAALAAAAFGQGNRCIIVKYPCDPIPTNIMFTVTDCQGKVLDMIPYRLGLPCLGQAQFCVPLAMGNVRIEAAVVSGHTIVKTETFSVGCI